MVTAVVGGPSGGDDEQVARLAAGSSNFGHLLRHEPLLVTLGCAAESYVHTDPHAAMVKTRLFGEIMARHLVTLLGVTVPVTRAHLEDFVQCYRPDEDRSKRVETERFKAYTYEELIARDKANLDITWLHDPSLDDADNLPAPEVLAAEIVEDLQAALEEFAAIAETLQQARGEGWRRRWLRSPTDTQTGTAPTN
ncbi:hypothetical protein [Streptomyces sp. JHA26]|uniref:hypothetical protein n=1 Tax=Streptomyces sp. JHA26 TaxID=1917143 RepID=UPI00209AC1C8|nr:hypothetical protein [Streptomyces sp. JHA26]